MYDPKKLNIKEYARQTIRAVEIDKGTTVEILIEEFGAKAYAQARKDVADDIAKMFGR